MISIRPLLALMLSLSIYLQASVIHFQDNQTFDLDTHQKTLGTDFNAFKKWMLAKDPSPQKKALIENTILDVHYPMTPTVTWAKAKMSDQDFDRLLASPLEMIPLVVNQVRGTYNYVPNNAYWVDFANASSFGGGFRKNGNVQEERMFMEFPQLAQLAYAKRDSPILPVSKNCNLPRENPGCAEPFLIFGILRRFDISNVPYGRAIEDEKPSQIAKEIVDLPRPYSIANIIGLAAGDRCDDKLKNKAYSLLDLKYLLKEALLGNLGAIKYNLQNGVATPEVHTGNWGAGAFKNSISMVVAIQILAGAMSQIEKDGTTYGIHLFFHITSASLVSQLKSDIIGRLQNGQTPRQVLNYLLRLQSDDPSTWGPQPC